MLICLMQAMHLLAVFSAEFYILLTAGKTGKYSNTTSGLLFGDIDFINQTTATAVGSSGIIRTTNTGVTGLTRHLPGNHYFQEVDFIDVNTGIAIFIEGHTSGQQMPEITGFRQILLAVI